jgi:plasmid maintenance system antidote protein VapI
MANSDAALKVARTTGQSASFYKSAQTYYNQVKKEENTASIILKSVTQKCGKEPRKQK